MRLDAITLDLLIKGYDVIPLVLKIEQELRSRFLIIMNGHGTSSTDIYAIILSPLPTLYH